MGGILNLYILFLMNITAYRYAEMYVTWLRWANASECGGDLILEPYSIPTCHLMWIIQRYIVQILVKYSEQKQKKKYLSNKLWGKMSYSLESFNCRNAQNSTLWSYQSRESSLCPRITSFLLSHCAKFMKITRYGSLSVIEIIWACYHVLSWQFMDISW